MIEQQPISSQPTYNLPQNEKRKLSSVLLMRHGQPCSIGGGSTYGTDQMPYDEFVDAIDINKTTKLPLSEKGRQDVRKSLENKTNQDLSHVKLVMCSPYIRTEQTAEEVVKYIKERLGVGVDLEIKKLDLLKEVEFSKDSIDQIRYESIMAKAQDEDPVEKAKGGVAGLMNYIDDIWMNRNNPEGMNETYYRAQRIITYLRRMGKWTNYDSVLICTHGIFGRVIEHVISGGSVPIDMNTAIPQIKLAEIRDLNADMIMELNGLQKDE